MKILTLAGTAVPFGPRLERRLAALRHIKALAEITESESQFLLRSASDATSAPAGMELLHVGAELNQPRIILSGWAGLSVFLPDGRRQLLDFALPGDLIGTSPRAGARAKASIICLTQLETIKLPALANGLDATGHSAGLLHVLQVAQDRFEDRLLNQIVRNGCLTALEKLCSLLLELYLRLHRAGLAEQETFELPISQVIIADALGLSTVHINRTFQQLKRDRIVQSEGHRLAITNFPALCRLAGRIAGDGGLDKDTDRI